VAVHLPRERAHLEEPEVLAVLCGRAKTRLAPGDGHGFLTVAAEDSADRDLRGRVSQQPLISEMDRPTERHDLPHRVSEVMPGTSQGLACDGSVMCRGEKPVMLPEREDDASLLVERDELPLEASLQRDRVVVPSRGSCIRRVSRLRCRSGLCHDDERAQASE
jgi:hypothetical protein